MNATALVLPKTYKTTDATATSSQLYLKSALEIVYAAFLTIIFLILAGYLLSFYPIFEPSKEIIDEMRQLFCKWSTEVYPKPREHFLLMSLYLLLPIVGVFSTILITVKFPFKSTANPLIWKSFIFSITILMSVPFIGNLKHEHGQRNFYMDELAGAILKDPLLLFLAVITTLIAFILLQRRSKTSVIAKPWDKTFVICVLGIILLQTFSIKIFNIYGINPVTPWWLHFQTIFYAVTQVVGGKTLLVDYTPQYGLYPELLKPIFSIIGFSVLKFSAIMSVLHAIAMVALFFFLRKFIRSRFLIFICSLLLCLTIGFTWIDSSLTAWDPFYQFSPIRFFFPAVSIYLFSIVAKRLHAGNVLLFSIFNAIGILWNLDSGIPVCGAFLAYLTAQIIFPKAASRKAVTDLLIMAILVYVSTISLFINYLFFKASAPLNLLDITKYQKIFYMTGFGMMPITRGFAPWQIICATYIFGITTALYSWLKGKPSLRWNVVFYLSVLGFAIFPYHEGRSHVYTLIAVSWPAFLIAFIMADYLLRLVRAEKLPRIFSAPALPIILMGVLSTANFFHIVPSFYQRAVFAWKGIFFKIPESSLTLNLAFINSHVKQDKEAIILGYDEAVYYAEAGLVSPLKGPTNGELVLVKDQKKQIEQLTNNHYKHIFVHLENNEIPKEFAYLLNEYRIVDRNAHLLYLTSKHLPAEK